MISLAGVQCRCSPRARFGSCLPVLGRMGCWCGAAWKTLHLLSSLTDTTEQLVRKKELGGSYVKHQSWRGRCGQFIVLTPDFSTPKSVRDTVPQRGGSGLFCCSLAGLCNINSCLSLLLVTRGALLSAITANFAYQAMPSSPRAALSNTQPPHTSPWENSTFLPFCKMRNLF